MPLPIKWQKWQVLVPVIAATVAAAGGITVAIINSGGGGHASSTAQPVNSVQAATTFPSLPATFPTPPTEAAPEVFLNRDSGPGGTQVLVSGQGFGPGERIIIRFHTTQVGVTTAGAQGGFANVAVVVPREYSYAAPHQFDIIADGQSTIRNASAPFTITG